MALTLSRKELKKEFPSLIEYIQRHHQDHPDVIAELFERHKPVKDLCNTRGYFIQSKLPGFEFMHYTMAVVIMSMEPLTLGRAVEEIVIYDNYIEYETHRTKALQFAGPKKADGHNLN